MARETAIFGAGCFWGVEEAFRNSRGVIDTEVGYMGGTIEAPTYEDVCTDRTGHAEVVRIIFDPDVVSYAELLDLFWTIHDPTQVDRQGPDVGTQYRSVIFAMNDRQRHTAIQARSALDASGKYAAPVATAVEDAGAFWRAEDYHQRYLAKRGKRTC